MLGSREKAEEILQDTFLRLYREASRYDPARGEAKAFVYAIARNLALSRLRRRKREPPKDLGLDPQDPEGEREEALGFWEGGRSASWPPAPWKASHPRSGRFWRRPSTGS